MRPTFVIGDLHGYPEALARLLREAGLADAGPRWIGADAALWLIGDLVAHGPDGLAVITTVMRLQREAAAVGGSLGCLLGNHDALLLAAARIGEVDAGRGRCFRDEWREAGGVEADLAGLTRQQIGWLLRLPAVARVGDNLLVHADSGQYVGYGETPELASAAFELLMRTDDAAGWRRVLDALGEHRAFWGPGGEERARALLSRLGGRRIVHGHTPIGKLTATPDAAVEGPLVYAGGLCINIDGGIYRGGPGFVYRLEAPAGRPGSAA